MFDDISFLSLDIDECVQERFNQKEIENRKLISSILAESRKNAKLNSCMYCDQKVTSFCNSHSVPAFCLRNIAEAGEVYYSNTFVKMPILDYDKGVKNAGTFNVICRDCDSTIFCDYENPDNYSGKLSNKMVAQIAMKNYLKMISKRLQEIALYNLLGDKMYRSADSLIQQQLVNKLDLDEYMDGFHKAKKLSTKDKAGYYVFFNTKLNYTVPMAFQGSIALISDLDGGVINNIYDHSPGYKTQDIHICVFPLKGSSVIFMFIDEESIRYRAFYKQFRKLSIDDQLAIVNFIIISYSEDYFISKKIPEEVINDKRITYTAQKSTIALSDSPFSNPIEKAGQYFDLSNFTDIPNLLCAKYALV